MPIFQFSKAFRIRGKAKIFFDLQGGVTRGVVPSIEQLQSRIKKLRNTKQRQAKALSQEQKRSQAKTGEVRRQRLEIFQLKNELDTLKEILGNQNVSSADQSPGEAEQVGALPDFVVVGAPRCGTSRFYGLLTEHLNVERAAVKEVHYFNRAERFSQGIEWYRRCFSPPESRNGHESITGEATPRYLAHPLVPERMAEVNPEVSLIALLRNPVDRAYSHYHRLARAGSALSFEEAVEAEQEWLLKKERHSSSKNGSSTNMLTTGVYVDHLQRWHEHFSQEQMLVLKSEDFYKDTAGTMNEVQDFLGLPHEELDLQSHETKYSYEPMNPETRQRLEEFFEPYNQRLYEYLGVDFGW